MQEHCTDWLETTLTQTLAQHLRYKCGSGALCACQRAQMSCRTTQSLYAGKTYFAGWDSKQNTPRRNRPCSLRFAGQITHAYLQLLRQVLQDLLCHILLTAIGTRTEEPKLVQLLTEPAHVLHHPKHWDTHLHHIAPALISHSCHIAPLDVHV